MPLDQINGGLNDQPKGTPPPIEKETMRGSPSFDRIKSAESGGPPPSWLKQFDTIVELIGLQPQKTYVASPPELEMILARTSAGGQPKSVNYREGDQGSQIDKDNLGVRLMIGTAFGSNFPVSPYVSRCGDGRPQKWLTQ